MTLIQGSHDEVVHSGILWVTWCETGGQWPYWDTALSAQYTAPSRALLQ